MAIKWSPGCGCCGGAVGCDEFTLGFTPTSALSRGEFSGIGNWQPLTEYLAGARFLQESLSAEPDGRFRLYVWEAPQTMFSGPGWTLYEESRYTPVVIADRLDDTAEWDLYGDTWDTMTEEEREAFLEAGLITDGIQMVSKADVIDPENYRVQWNWILSGGNTATVRTFANADGPYPQDYFWTERRLVDPVPVYDPPPAFGYTLDLFQQIPPSNIARVWGKRQGGSETEYDVGYVAAAAQEQPPSQGVSLQPNTTQITGTLTLGQQVQMSFRNEAKLCIDAGVYTFPIGAVELAAGDVLVFRPTAVEQFATQSQDVQYYERIPAADIELEFIAFGGLSVHAKELSPVDLLSGKKIGLEYSGDGSLSFANVSGSRSKTISTVECPIVFSGASGCSGDNDRILHSPLSVGHTSLEKAMIAYGTHYGPDNPPPPNVIQYTNEYLPAAQNVLQRGVIGQPYQFTVTKVGAYISYGSRFFNFQTEWFIRGGFAVQRISVQAGETYAAENLLWSESALQVITSQNFTYPTEADMLAAKAVLAQRFAASWFNSASRNFYLQRDFNGNFIRNKPVCLGYGSAFVPSVDFDCTGWSVVGTYTIDEASDPLNPCLGDEFTVFG